MSHLCNWSNSSIWTTAAWFCFIVKVAFGTSRAGSSSGNNNNQEGETCQTSDEEYVCTVGHCCQSERCCTYYYELWWFWLIWAVIILLSCCCAYHHRRKRRGARARSTQIYNPNALPYTGACNYPGPPVEKGVLGYCKLPPYDEIIRVPPTTTPPPPYTSRRQSIHQLACLQPNANGEMMMTIIPCHVTGSMLSLASLSHYVPSIMAQHGIAMAQTSNASADDSATALDIDGVAADDEPLSNKTAPGSSTATKLCVIDESRVGDAGVVGQADERTALCEPCLSDDSEEDDDEWALGDGVDQNNNNCEVVHSKASDADGCCSKRDESLHNCEDICASGLSLSR